MGHTVIQVPVPALESIAARLEVALVCPHVTVLGPFVDRSDVDVALLREVLPISVTADEVTLSWWSEDIVEVVERYPLRTG
ncbi:hypothetical protein [Cellulomonas sp.]|uniref:hypothetical protein n=1 Tax=Cellulomonas sp. TaxID=40001 RepID=UPI003BAC4600